MTPQNQNQPFRNVILPKLPSQITPQHRDRFAQLADLLDNVGRFDVQSQEMYIDETGFRQVLRQFLPGSENKAITELQSIPGNKLVPTGGTTSTTTLQVTGWSTLAATIRPERPLPVSDSTLGPSPSVDDIRLAAQRVVPQLPDNVFDDPKVLRQHLVDAFNPPNVAQEAAQPRFYDPWGCLLNHLGFWGAVAALVFVAACLAALEAVLSAGPLLTWALFWQAFISIAPNYGILYVIIVVVSCLIGFTPPF